VEEASTQQRNTLLHATRSELLERLEERIEDVRVRWDAELTAIVSAPRRFWIELSGTRRRRGAIWKKPRR